MILRYLIACAPNSECAARASIFFSFYFSCSSSVFLPSSFILFRQCCNSAYLFLFSFNIFKRRSRRCLFFCCLFTSLTVLIRSFELFVVFNCCASYLKPKQKINHQYVIWCVFFFIVWFCFICCYRRVLYFIFFSFVSIFSVLFRPRRQFIASPSSKSFLFLSFNRFNSVSNSRSRQFFLNDFFFIFFIVSLRLTTITSIAIGNIHVCYLYRQKETKYYQSRQLPHST